MSDDTAEEAPGLGRQSPSEWPAPPLEEGEEPINRLDPSGSLHNEVLEYLKERIRDSEEAVAPLRDRWDKIEKKVTAYIDRGEEDSKQESRNEQGKPPVPTTMVIPHTFAVSQTIVTYLIHTFFGRRPFFQVTGEKSETAKAAQYMQQVLQYQADNSRLIQEAFKFLNDAVTKGVGVLHADWVVDQGERAAVTFNEQEQIEERTTETRTVYEGNRMTAIDPYMFLPDPSVPMHRVNKDGEFVFWRTLKGRHELKRMENQGKVMWVDYVGQINHSEFYKYIRRPERTNRWGGSESGVYQTGSSSRRQRNTVEITQGTVEIIPAELGLGDSMSPEKWLFTIANGKQIIQAERFHAHHNMHPVCVTEPYSNGHTFGAPSIVDYIYPFQDIMSWLVNSRMRNVRSTLNNQFLVNPQHVETQDLRASKPGGYIRLKPPAMSTPLEHVMRQLEVRDVTQNHLSSDLEQVARLSDTTSAINDNLKGTIHPGSRRTATEVRTSGEAAASRLAALARNVSAQSIVDLTEMMSLNTQQHLSPEFASLVIGEDKALSLSELGSGMMTGDFHFPTHDGTLPMDSVALLEMWRETLQTAVSDPELRAAYSLTDIFERIAELGGIRDIDSVKVLSDDQIEKIGNVTAAQQLGIDPAMLTGAAVQGQANLQGGQTVPPQQGQGPSQPPSGPQGQPSGAGQPSQQGQQQ